MRTLRSKRHIFLRLKYVAVSAVKIPLSCMESLNCTMKRPPGKFQWGSAASSYISQSGVVMW